MPSDNDEVIEILRSFDERLTSIEARLSTGAPGGAPVGSSKPGTLKPSQYGGYAIEFDRTFNSDVESVWKTITDPERMADWYADAKGDVNLGGRLELHFPNSGAVAYAMVTQMEPPNVFEHMWVTGQLEDPAQPMPNEIAARGGTCGDLTLASSTIRYILTAMPERGTRVQMNHYVPLNPRLLGEGVARAARDSKNPVSMTPAPDMVLATWDILMDQLEMAVSNPGIRAMSRSADRSASWAWDRFEDLRRSYQQVVS